MYENRTPKQQNALIYGAKLRCIGGVQGLLSSVRNNDQVNPFTSAELQTIKGICTNAQARAKATFDETTLRLDTTADLGTSSEPRTYNGK